MPKNMDQEFCVKLIEVIQKYPCIYNQEISEYSRRDAVDKAWADVAAEMKHTVHVCKKKWKNMRTAYVRSIKVGPSREVKKYKRPYYLWDIMHFLTPFVKVDILGNLQSPQTTDAGNDDDDNESEGEDKFTESEDFPPVGLRQCKKEVLDTESQHVQASSEPRGVLQSATPSTTTDVCGKKRKASELSDGDKTIADSCKYRTVRSGEDEDPTKMFLLSLMPDLEQMDNAQLRQFKRKVLGVIDEILCGDDPLSTA